MYFLKLCGFGLIVLLFSGCSYKIDKTADTAGQGIQDATAIDFKMVRDEILAPKCLSCHASDTNNRSGLVLETYLQVQAELSAIQDSVTTDFMPLNRAPLTTAQKNLLSSWIQAGAPEIVDANPKPQPPAELPPVEPPPPIKPPAPVGPARDWASVNTLVIEPSCVGCHSAPANRGGVNLESYQNVFANIVEVESTIRDGSMPRRNKLTPLQKELILDWISLGSPEFATSNN